MGGGADVLSSRNRPFRITLAAVPQPCSRPCEPVECPLRLASARNSCTGGGSHEECEHTAIRSIPPAPSASEAMNSGVKLPSSTFGTVTPGHQDRRWGGTGRSTRNGRQEIREQAVAGQRLHRPGRAYCHYGGFRGDTSHSCYFRQYGTGDCLEKGRPGEAKACAQNVFVSISARYCNP